MKKNLWHDITFAQLSIFGEISEKYKTIGCLLNGVSLKKYNSFIHNRGYERF